MAVIQLLEVGAHCGYLAVVQGALFTVALVCHNRHIGWAVC